MIDVSIERLENEKLHIKSQLNNTENGNSEIDENGTYNKILLEKIDNKIMYLQQKRELEKQKEYFKNILATRDMAQRLVGLIYNSNTVNEVGNLVDDII